MTSKFVLHAALISFLGVNAIAQDRHRDGDRGPMDRPGLIDRRDRQPGWDGRGGPVSGVQKSIRLSLNTILTGGGQPSLCLDREIFNASGDSIIDMSKIRIELRGESVRVRDGNELYAMDANGQIMRTADAAFVDRTVPVMLPYLPAVVRMDVLDFAKDICLNSKFDGKLDSFTVSYVVDSRGGRPNPPLPIDPPPPPRPIDPPPRPIDPPAPRLEGKIGSISPMGEVLGWACSPLREPLIVNLYVGGQLENSAPANINIEADRDGRGKFGTPSFTCGALSGFRIPFNAQRYEGQSMTFEIRGVNRRNNSDFTLDAATFVVPRGRLPEGIFRMDNAFFFSNSIDGFCQINSADQLKARRTMGYNDLGTVSAAPSRMRFTGICQDIKFPKSLLRTRTGDTQKVYYSSGDNYCWVQHPGMLSHVISAFNVRNTVVDYENLPPQNLMPYLGVCKVPGLFKVNNSAEIYEADGRSSFCHVMSGESIRGQPVFNYEAFPEGMVNRGDCNH